MSRSRQALRVGMAAFVTAIALGVFAYLLAFHRTDSTLKPGELSLSGTWKLSFKDSIDYAAPTLDDSAWCLITVPNAGVRATGAPGDHPSSACPRDSYPKDKMRGTTYWYRKTFDLPPARKWKTPSLFLGAIKDRAWVYLDGKFLGATTLEQSPAILLLDPPALTPGRHVLAVRVTTFESQNPGIFHTYTKGVMIGDFADTRSGIAENVNIGIIEPVAFLAIQAASLILCLLLLLRGRGQVDPSMIWLATYFLAAFAHSVSHPLPGLLLPNDRARWLFQFLGATGMATGLMGFGSRVVVAPRVRSTVNLILAAYAVAIMSVIIFLFARNKMSSPFAHWLDLGVTTLPFVAAIIAPLLPKSWRGFEANHPRLERNETLILVLVVLLHLCFFLARVVGSTYAIPVPLSGISTALTFLVALLSVDAFVLQQQELAFFGRFIRSGLRALLGDSLRAGHADQKLFRGRQIPALKVDVVGHTDVTYGMPYGVKRLYQDLLFTHIDHMVAKFTFLDRSEGDGSIYFFLENIEGGSCATALRVAQAIRDVAIPKFDEDFTRQMRTLVEGTPELRTAMAAYLESYRRRNQRSFFERKTEVRISLVFGFADEGLWGLSSQSHYQMEGDLVTLLARLEKSARPGSILTSLPFLEQLQTENPSLAASLSQERMSIDLKGIGPTEVVVLNMPVEAQAS